jgi:hypothetical protein
MKTIYYHHMEANPDLPSDAYLAEHRAARDRLVAELKAQGKRVILVKAEHLEDCGRYVCEGDDGVNGYDPLPGTITVEQEV